MVMKETIRASLKNHFTGKLVDELLDSYEEAKRNYYLGGLRLSEVEGGRFSEAVFRLLEEQTTGHFTPLNRQLDVERLIRTLENLPVGSYPNSIRLHIPRALRVVYDVRNNRDAAHLSDGVDPNIQDSTLVMSVLDWILAEYVRLNHGVSIHEAQHIVDELVKRRVPAIQDFGGFPKVLNPRLKASECVLVLLYEKLKEGAMLSELEKWLLPKMRANMKSTLSRLEYEKAHVHYDDVRYFITEAGMRYVEEKRLYESIN